MDQAYQGQTDATLAVVSRIRDCTSRRYRFGQRVDEAIKAKNRNKSRACAKVEHSIGVIKRVRIPEGALSRPRCRIPDDHIVPSRHGYLLARRVVAGLFDRRRGRQAVSCEESRP